MHSLDPAPPNITNVFHLPTFNASVEFNAAPGLVDYYESYIVSSDNSSDRSNTVRTDSDNFNLTYMTLVGWTLTPLQNYTAFVQSVRSNLTSFPYSYNFVTGLYNVVGWVLRDSCAFSLYNL